MKKASAYGKLVRHELKINQQTLDCLNKIVKSHNETKKPRTNVSETIEMILRRCPDMIDARTALGIKEWDQRKPNGRPLIKSNKNSQ